jgi:hypothetical protein
MDIGEFLSGAVRHDEARIQFFQRPWRREPAGYFVHRRRTTLCRLDCHDWPGGVRDNRHIWEILATVEGLIAVKIRSDPPRLVFARSLAPDLGSGGTYLVTVLGKAPRRIGEARAICRQLGGPRRESVPGCHVAKSSKKAFSVPKCRDAKSLPPGSSDASFSPAVVPLDRACSRPVIETSVGETERIACFYQINNNLPYLVSAWAAVARLLMYNARSLWTPALDFFSF